jgi:hypothetical protein
MPLRMQQTACAGPGPVVRPGQMRVQQQLRTLW